MKFLTFLIIFFSVACTRIETDKVGLHFDSYNKVRGNVLLSNTWNQTIFGTIKTFPTTNIVVNVSHKRPLTADNVILSNIDVTVVYNINELLVKDMYGKPKFYHESEKLMYNYVYQLVEDTEIKVIRSYENSKIYDNRVNIEEQMLSLINEKLISDKLNDAISINVIRITNMIPNEYVLNTVFAENLIGSK